jgi:predicted O-linked N-acetylglucosamine transferase (SPINDLY family)
MSSKTKRQKIPAPGLRRPQHQSTQQQQVQHTRLLEALELQRVGEVDRAKAMFESIVAQNPAAAAAWYSIAVIAHQEAELDKALDAIDRCLEEAPNFQQARQARQVIRTAIRSREALASGTPLRQAGMPPLPAGRSPHPDCARALQAQAQGQSAQAEALFELVLAQDPDDFVALYSLCVMRMQAHRSREALVLIDRAAQILPQYAPVHFARGTVLQALGLFEDALKSFDEALRLDASYIEAYNNKANLLHTLHRHHEALACLEQALALDPEDEKALGNLGYVMTEYKRNARAAELFNRLLEINPFYEYAEGLRAYALLHCCDWRGYEEHVQRIRDGIAQGRRSCNPLAFMAISDSPPEQLRCAQIFAAHRFPEHANPLWRGEPYSHRKIRVGYVSPDFREHPVGHAFCGVVEKHDRNRLELFGISLGINDGSRLRERYKLAFDHFLDAREMLSAELARWVRAMEIDVLVDLAGYTSGSRADMFAMRPAPIQVSYLGFPGTLGAPYMDYIVADKVVIPDENRPYYQEHVVWLPHAYFPADRSIEIPSETPSRSQCGLPDEGFVFCSFNHDYKINPAVFAVWMRLLKQTPQSVLWLMKLNEDAQSHLLGTALEAGVDASRIVFATRVPRIEDHLARYRQADLFLDTHPYNAHTTANDALRAGLPLLSYQGGSFPSRVASSLLTTLGMPELIATTLEAYEAKALHWAHNPDALAAIRTSLKEKLIGNPLLNTDRQARALEVAYHVMVQKRDSGAGAGPIEVRA